MGMDNEKPSFTVVAVGEDDGGDIGSVRFDYNGVEGFSTEYHARCAVTVMACSSSASLKLDLDNIPLLLLQQAGTAALENHSLSNFRLSRRRVQQIFRRDQLIHP